MQNYSYENDFDLHENESACRTHFHIKGFALRLVLKQWHENSEMAYRSYHSAFTAGGPAGELMQKNKKEK